VLAYLFWGRRPRTEFTEDTEGETRKKIEEGRSGSAFMGLRRDKEEDLIFL